MSRVITVTEPEKEKYCLIFEESGFQRLIKDITVSELYQMRDLIQNVIDKDLHDHHNIK